MCSDCCDTDSDGEEAQVDADAPRTLRGRTKIRKPGKYRKSEDSDGGGIKLGSPQANNGTRKKSTNSKRNKRNTSPKRKKNPSTKSHLVNCFYKLYLLLIHLCTFRLDANLKLLL